MAVDGRRRWPLVVVAGVAAAVLAGSWLAVLPDGPRGWEGDVAREVAGLPGWLTPVLEAVMQLGNRAVALAAGVVVGFTAGRRVGIATAAAGMSAWALTAALKPLVDRPRPAAATLVVDGPGFPSSHAAVSAAVVVAVLFLARPRAPLAAGLVAAATLTALARVHLGAHWPLDVIAGAAAGALAATGCAAWAARAALR